MRRRMIFNGTLKELKDIAKSNGMIDREDVREAVKELKEKLCSKCPFGKVAFDYDNSARLLAPKDVLESIDEIFGDLAKEKSQ